MLKPDIMINMDHTRVSGIEPSSVILSQTKYYKRLECNAKIMPKQVEAKGDGVRNPQNYNLVNFKTRKILMLLKTVRINRIRP